MRINSETVVINITALPREHGYVLYEFRLSIGAHETVAFIEYFPGQDKPYMAMTTKSSNTCIDRINAIKHITRLCNDDRLVNKIDNGMELALRDMISAYRKLLDSCNTK